jgi:hypothetical protein
VNCDIVGQVLADYEETREPDADPQLEAIKVAVLLEDVFGIVLSDSEIDPGVLAEPTALQRLVAQHLSGR